MTWTLGDLIFSPRGEGGWMASHAQVPTLLPMNDRLRVYFSSRVQRNLSQTSYLDMEKKEPFQVQSIHQEPILPLGQKGAFDEHGIMPSSAIRVDDKVFMYYSGWKRCHDVPYRNFIGLAISQDGGHTFIKTSQEPLLPPTEREPYSATSPFVMKDTKIYRMWYCSGIGWLEVDSKKEHIYDIKYAESSDGITWYRSEVVSIPQLFPEEAITRPSVIKMNNTYYMWFCSRHSRDFRGGQGSYQIGHASSLDGVNWTRVDSPIQFSNSKPWNSKMSAYPYVFPLENHVYMLLNGNDFGSSGFGFAKCDLF